MGFEFEVIGDIKGKNALIFDDEVDTAGSIMETVEVCKKFGAKDVYVGCTHGVLSGPAIERLQKSEIKEIIAARLNNNIVSLKTPITNDGELEFFNRQDKDGRIH